MNKRIFTPVLLFAMILGTNAQDDTYIMKRKTYKISPSSINISPDGSLLLTGFQDGSFRLMDPETFLVSLEVKGAHVKAVNAMDMPPKMDFVLTAGQKTIKLWDLAGKHIGNLNAHATTIWNVDISNDGKYAVSSAFNKTFLLWDLYNGEVLEKMQGHDDVTMSVSISPDNRWIASGSNDLSVRVWDIQTRQVVKTLHGPTQDVYDVAFSPDSRLVAVASKDRSVRVYNLEEEKLVHLLKGHRDMVMEVGFSPDGQYLASGSADQSIYLWDVGSGERIHAYLDNEEAVLDLVFHPDGKSFYSISFAGDLTKWAVHPEIFVLKYYEKPYRDELEADPLFEPRRKGEAKKDYQDRQSEAEAKKAEILKRYYQLYLDGRPQ
ncbi:MAG: WD40 repeat domain-containing protein [Bacteroidales bacterium]|nr:WD40 repeat domain-containing protein [Bacteroidales bacterium]